MLKILSLISLLLAPQARSDAPVIWSGTTAKWLPSGLHSAGLCKLDAAGVQTSGQASLTTNVSGILPLANGGTNKNMTPVSGGLVYTDSDSEEVGAAGTTGQAAISGGTGAPTWFAPTVGSVLFAGASGILAQDNANFSYTDSSGLLTLNNGNGAGTTGIKIFSSAESQLQIEDTASTTHWTVGASGGVFYFEKSGFPWLSHTSVGTQMFGASGAPKWTFNNLVDDTSTSASDIIPGGAIHDLSIFMSQNPNATVNNYSGYVTSGGTPGSTSTTSADTAMLGVHEVHTAGSETAHLEFYVENAGAGLAKALNLAKDRTVTMPAYGAGISRFNSSGVLSSSELSGDVTTSGSNATTVAKIQSTTVSGTTGTTNVVFSSAPTMTNPVVGTQATGDNSTKAASTAFVQAQLAQLNPAAAVKAASTANVAGTYTNSVGGVCIGDTLQVTSTAAFALDGITPTVGQRVLLKNQSSAFQNGVWTLTTAANVGVLGALLTRALDWDSSADMNAGSLIPVISGTTLANTVWYQTSTVTTCNSDSQVYTQFTGGSSGSLCSVLTKTADYSVQTSDFNANGCLMIYANCSSKCTMTAPAASASGRLLKVKQAGSAEVDIAATVDGDSAGVKMNVQYTSSEIDDIGGSEWSLF